MAKGFIETVKTIEFRKWLYGVTTAGLLVLSGYGVIDSVASQNFNVLAGAILVAGVTGVAERNTKPTSKTN